MFRTQYSERQHYFSNHGTLEEPSYTLKVLDDGTKDLVQTGVVNTYEQIQSHKDSVDLKQMIARFENGDFNALNKREGMFIDCTKMPRNMAEVYQIAIDAENYFNELPLDIRKEFNFNVGEFMAANDDKLAAVFGPRPDSPAPDKIEKPEVKENNVNE